MAFSSLKKMVTSPLSEPVDLLLADVAIRVQLTNTDYNKAVERYHSVADWLDRPESLLQGRVNRLYAQGSIAIGATIASKMRTDEFDIDVIADLALPIGTAPQHVLDLLYGSIRGERGSRYYSMAERRTRCVTIHYADDMHLDVTPAILLPVPEPRTSHIFHSKPEEHDEPDRTLMANPYGFAEWYKASTPLDHDFVALFEKRAGDWERLVKAAETETVPAQQPPYRKSKATIALQLIKRWRNVRYDRRAGRRPPSIVLARLIADAANHTDTLSEELHLQAAQLLENFSEWHRAGLCIQVVNPRCAQDVFTDRWPSSLAEQEVFIHDLGDLVAKLAILRGECPLDRIQEIMKDLFGEAPTLAAFKAFTKRTGHQISTGQSYHQPRTGRLDLAATGLLGATVAPSPATVRTRPHTFFGADEDV